ncbi:MAG: site-2 protease family protein [Gemmatimonadota bacterium]
MKSSIRFGRLFGIEIGAHVSWLVILVLVTMSVVAHFGLTQPEWSRVTRWAAGLVTSILFFGSVVAHELAHSLVARRFGVPVRSITLFLFGGLAQIESEPKRPAHELWIAGAGPLSSLALGALFGGLAALAPAGVPGAVAAWLGGINVALAFFNLLPGFPLDGGRVLRAVVWWKTGDPRRATRVAAAGGKLLALLLIVGGIWTFFTPGTPGGNLGGLWLAFIGWFLLEAARSGEAQVEMRHALRGVRAADLMTADAPRIPPDLPLESFVHEHLLRTGRRCFVVADRTRAVGLLTAGDLRAVPRERWPELTVVGVMRPLESLHAVAPDTGGDRVLEILGREDLNQLPVLCDGRLEGIVSREHVIRMLTTRMEFAS